MGPPLDDLIDELSQEINRTGPALAWEDARFLAWAERIATFQAALRPQLQEPPPRPLHSLEQIPALTTDVFRYAELGTLDRPPAVVFQTSGTLAAFRGRHALPRVDLYAASILAAFDHRVPEAARCRRLISLVEPAARLPDSSLAFMVTHLAEERFAGRAAFPLGAGGLDRASLAAALAESVAAGASTLVFTTTLAAASLLETGLTAELPPGSVLLTTGGAKGRRGGVDPAAVEVELGRRLGGLVVGAEYGMTELSSQAYRVGPRPFRLPAWCRVLAIDPATGRRRPHGTRGLLRFIDLANAHSAVAVQTADQGATHSDHTFTLLGRAVGAPLRGCSLSFEEIAGGAP